jgi:hypothetical protein
MAGFQSEAAILKTKLKQVVKLYNNHIKAEDDYCCT